MNEMTRIASSEIGDSGGKDARLTTENFLLRNALEDARARIAELEMLADTDTLTPLANRRAFLRELDRVMKNAARHGTQSALLFLDLDGMKAINDAHGHQTGDALLIHVANALLGMVRATDLVARLGGDEFGMILGHLSEQQARAKAEMIREALAARPLMIGNLTIDVMSSCGVAMICEEESAESAIARADAEMYLDKSLHRAN